MSNMGKDKFNLVYKSLASKFELQWYILFYLPPRSKRRNCEGIGAKIFPDGILTPTFIGESSLSWYDWASMKYVCPPFSATGSELWSWTLKKKQMIPWEMIYQFWTKKRKQADFRILRTNGRMNRITPHTDFAFL